MKICIEVAASALVAMFVISGMTKVVTFGTSEADRFAEKTGLRKYAQHVVFLAGVIELYGAFMILRGVWQHNASQKASLKRVHHGSNVLVAFTVAATLVFYVKPFKYKPTLANMTTIAGLLLLPQVCELKH
tara:strand:+ start:251 stop:643 length:393 start_codon:yes stop_codon:yes gene_type:complete